MEGGYGGVEGEERRREERRETGGQAMKGRVEGGEKNVRMKRDCRDITNAP